MSKKENEPKGVSGFINDYVETTQINLEYMSYGEFRPMIITFIRDCNPTLNVFSSFLHVMTGKVSPSAGRILRTHLRVFTQELYSKSNITA